jgi:hypothetical protein
MKSFAIATLVAAVSAAPISGMEFKFINYLAKYSKSYATVEEYQMRLEAFALNEYEITRHNGNNTQWKMGHNKFSDRTGAEMETMLQSKARYPVQEPTILEVSNAFTPIDWIMAGAVNAI